MIIEDLPDWSEWYYLRNTLQTLIKQFCSDITLEQLDGYRPYDVVRVSLNSARDAEQLVKQIENQTDLSVKRGMLKKGGKEEGEEEEWKDEGKIL